MTIITLALIFTYVMGMFVTDEYLETLNEVQSELEPLPKWVHYLIMLGWPFAMAYSLVVDRLGIK